MITFYSPTRALIIALRNHWRRRRCHHWHRLPLDSCPQCGEM